MDKLTIFTLISALIFLIIIITISRSYYSVSPKSEPVTLPSPPAALSPPRIKDNIRKAAAKRSDSEIKEEATAIEEERVLPAPDLLKPTDAELHPGAEVYLPGEFEEQILLQDYPPDEYPIDYIPMGDPQDYISSEDRPADAPYPADY